MVLARCTADRTRDPQSGFTLVEVALAILCGIIVSVAATVAFNFAKRSAISTKQQRDVQMFKSLVESLKANQQGVALTGAFYQITGDQMKTFADANTGRIPAMGRDPYTGNNRQFCDISKGGCPSGAIYVSYGPVSEDATITSVNQINGEFSTASDLIYVYGLTTGIKFTVVTVDTISRTFVGYCVMESDSNGQIVAVAGGGTGDE